MQTDSSLIASTDNSSDQPDGDDDMAYSDPGSDLSPPYTPASPDFSPDCSPYRQPPSTTDYSPTSPVYPRSQ